MIEMPIPCLVGLSSCHIEIFIFLIIQKERFLLIKTKLFKSKDAFKMKNAFQSDHQHFSNDDLWSSPLKLQASCKSQKSFF